MKVVVIASGSKGNSTYIEEDGFSILIDAGISYKRINEAINSYGVPNAIFITHEHNDHISSLRIVANKYNIPVYISKKTYDALPMCQKDINAHFIKTNDVIFIGNLKILAIPIFHDAKDPLGFVVSTKNKKLVYITDTGYVHSSIFQEIKNADAYILESNHDPDVLMNSERTFELKRRILGDRGHLCNEDSAYLLCEVLGDKTKVIVHAHISLECNFNELIINTMKQIFMENGLNYENFKTTCASQTIPYYFEV